jgi:hypothetical protein
MPWVTLGQGGTRRDSAPRTLRVLLFTPSHPAVAAAVAVAFAVAAAGFDAAVGRVDPRTRGPTAHHHPHRRRHSRLHHPRAGRQTGTQHQARRLPQSQRSPVPHSRSSPGDSHQTTTPGYPRRCCHAHRAPLGCIQGAARHEQREALVACPLHPHCCQLAPQLTAPSPRPRPRPRHWTGTEQGCRRVRWRHWSVRRRYRTRVGHRWGHCRGWGLLGRHTQPQGTYQGMQHPLARTPPPQRSRRRTPLHWRVSQTPHWALW